MLFCCVHANGRRGSHLMVLSCAALSVACCLLWCNKACPCLQEVTDLVDKVSLSMDLVKSELKRAPAHVTVTIACSPEPPQCQHAQQHDVDGVPMQQQGNHSQGVPRQGASLLQQQGQGQGQGVEQSPGPKQRTTKTQQQHGKEQGQAGQQLLRPDQGGDMPQQQHGKENQQRGQEEASPGMNLARHKLVLVELVSDNYQDVMTETVHEVESDLKLCRQLLQQCKESFSCLVSFYGDNAQAFATDAVFWSDVTAFVDRFTACQKQLRKQIQVCRCLDLLLQKHIAFWPVTFCLVDMVVAFLLLAGIVTFLPKTA